MSIVQWRFLGEIPYLQAWDWQKTLRKQRIARQIEDQILLLEHPATITLGRLRGEKSLLHPVDFLEQKNIEVIRSDRGGDATLHAPGQMVGYLILSLTEMGLTLPVFVERLAGFFVRYLQHFDLNARYDTKYPGVWVGDEKIVAFGFHLLQGVTMHGFAINLHTDLSLFDLIVPCGLQQKGATSLAHLLQNSEHKTPSLAEAAPVIAEGIAHVLELHPVHLQEWPLLDTF